MRLKAAPACLRHCQKILRRSIVSKSKHNKMLITWHFQLPLWLVSVICNLLYLNAYVGFSLTGCLWGHTYAWFLLFYTTWCIRFNMSSLFDFMSICFKFILMLITVYLKWDIASQQILLSNLLGFFVIKHLWPGTTKSKGTWCRPGLFWDNEQNSV